MDWIQGGEKEDFSVTPSFLEYGNWVGFVLFLFFWRGEGRNHP